MKTDKYFALKFTTFLALIAFIFLSTALAQQKAIQRTDLQQHNLSIPGHETVQARIDFEPHTSFGKHNHPGEEIIYVLHGSLEYQIEDEQPITLKAGQVLFIAAGKFHSAKNNTDQKASELATYIVQKGKPILAMKK
nr:cupin domain-containing protein [Flavobacterium sp. ASV13]